MFLKFSLRILVGLVVLISLVWIFTHSEKEKGENTVKQSQSPEATLAASPSDIQKKKLPEASLEEKIFRLFPQGFRNSNKIHLKIENLDFQYKVSIEIDGVAIENGDLVIRENSDSAELISGHIPNLQTTVDYFPSTNPETFKDSIESSLKQRGAIQIENIKILPPLWISANRSVLMPCLPYEVVYSSPQQGVISERYYLNAENGDVVQIRVDNRGFEERRNEPQSRVPLRSH